MANGFFLGGLAKGFTAEQDRRKKNEAAARALDLKERLIAVDEQDAEIRARAQEMDARNRQRDSLIASRAKVLAGAENLINQANQLIDLGRAQNADESAINKSIEPLVRAAVASITEAGGNPDVALARIRAKLSLTPSAQAAAEAEARTGVAGQAARADALQGQGVAEDAARRQSFGLPAPADNFDFVAADELQQLGFPKNAIVQKNTATGEVRVISDGTVPGAGAVVKIEQDLRRDFDKQSQKFEDSQRNFLSMQQLADDKTGASDVALVFSFFKTIDPTSTIREGEFATAARAAGLPAQFIQSFARLDSGEILPDSLRAELVSAAGRFFQQRLLDQRARESFFRGLATNANVSPGNVVRSRIRSADTGRFAGMTTPELNAINIDDLSDAEVKQLNDELKGRGF